MIGRKLTTTVAARVGARQASTSSSASASTLPIPPKIATPSSVSGSGGNSARMESVVSFYKALPKGEAPAKRGGGIKARFFDGKNASGAPIVATIGALLLLGYTIDYNMHLKHHKNAHH
ncbi:ATP synthase f chain, mitochondrial precursor [Tilletia horrida]|uniref:ATP synthase f chain, mitochondrial n=1 Tax=Tilletia horrida TaxID=155126 RepID=A0AAN6G6M3_9BASI|nr:ATP synthase f chain, mitochondrial precursor [Tilletia horrida]KAK0531767.1 ATP synthase f chain, mitochondrial precursor [Tilletia horrida]KAK0534727.1 ATP synthase f chain, mitochondrial precursor [Tilletia horrida]KAK0554020.1 ATP synthase f chain, mitochondrial precursor [Tilletia horrida]